QEPPPSERQRPSHSLGGASNSNNQRFLQSCCSPFHCQPRAVLAQKTELFMATAPKIPLPIHEIENVLAFRTKVGAETVRGGESKNLGTVDTSRFDKIRLVADERIG